MVRGKSARNESTGSKTNIEHEAYRILSTILNKLEGKERSQTRVSLPAFPDELTYLAIAQESDLSFAEFSRITQMVVSQLSKLGYQAETVTVHLFEFTAWLKDMRMQNSDLNLARVVTWLAEGTANGQSTH